MNFLFYLKKNPIREELSFYPLGKDWIVKNSLKSIKYRLFFYIYVLLQL